MTTAPVRPDADPILSWLRISAAASALCGLIQTLLGMGLLGDLAGVYPIHRTIGYTAVVVTVIAVVFAVLWARRSGNKGLMFHAISVAVLAVIQVGVGEMSLTWLHVVLGVLFLVAAGALATLAFRKPGERRPLHEDPAGARGRA